MRGRGLSQRLKNINLKNDMELEKIEEIEEIPGIKTPPRQIKSPTKFASPHSAFQPYDKITALGIFSYFLKFSDSFYSTIHFLEKKEIQIGLMEVDDWEEGGVVIHCSLHNN